jgi:hypothetical protein
MLAAVMTLFAKPLTFVTFVAVVTVPAVMFVVLATVAFVGKVIVPPFTTGLVLIVSTSTFCVVLIVVPERSTAVVGLPTFAQSTPASPPADTSSALPAVVGLSAAVLRIVKLATTEPTTLTLSTVPVVITMSKNEPAE